MNEIKIFQIPFDKHFNFDREFTAMINSEIEKQILKNGYRVMNVDFVFKPDDPTDHEQEREPNKQIVILTREVN